MPFFGVTNLNQKAVVWMAMGVDGYGNTKVSATPQELKVRWDDVIDEQQTPDGTTKTVGADIVVKIDVPVGSAIWKGGLADLPGTSVIPESDVMYVTEFNKVPDLKNRNFFRKLKAMRFNDGFPATA